MYKSFLFLGGTLLNTRKMRRQCGKQIRLFISSNDVSNSILPQTNVLQEENEEGLKGMEQANGQIVTCSDAIVRSYYHIKQKDLSTPRSN